MYSEIFFIEMNWYFMKMLKIVLLEKRMKFKYRIYKINLCCSIEKVRFYETVANIIRKTVF